MATPADVVAGEVIEVEWGNAVRDFACFGLEMATTIGNGVSSVPTTTLTDCLSVTFTKPADWSEYEIMAWVGVTGIGFTGSTNTYNFRVVIGASNGSTALLQGDPLTFPSGSGFASHKTSGLTGASTVVKLQDAKTTAAGGSTVVHTLGNGVSLSYIARRTG